MAEGKGARTKTSLETQMVKSAAFAINHVALKGFSLATQTAFTAFPRAIFKRAKELRQRKVKDLGKELHQIMFSLLESVKMTTAK